MSMRSTKEVIVIPRAYIYDEWKTRFLLTKKREEKQYLETD